MANTVKSKKVVPVRIIVLAAVLAVVVIIGAVTLFLGRDKPTQAVPLLATGNRGGNLAGGGAAVEANGSVYLADAVSGEILKVTPGQIGGTPIGASGRYLNTDGASLWYADRATGQLMKIDLNGGSPAVVVASRVSRPLLAGDYIYYIDVDSNCALSRIAVADGSAPELLSAARVQQFAIVGRKIFYWDLNGADCASYMNLDGSAAKELSSIRFGQVLFGQDNRLYYANADRDGAIDYLELASDNVFYGPASNAADNAAVVDTGTITAAVADGSHIYYVKAADGCLYRRGLTAAAAEERLTDFPVFGIQDAGGYIYVQSVADGGAFSAVAK